jgi:hypothetical protein
MSGKGVGDLPDGKGRDYEVGYGKPPKKDQFRKGVNRPWTAGGHLV